MVAWRFLERTTLWQIVFRLNAQRRFDGYRRDVRPHRTSWRGPIFLPLRNYRSAWAKQLQSFEASYHAYATVAGLPPRRGIVAGCYT